MMKFIQNSQFLRADKGGCLLKSYEFSQTEAEVFAYSSSVCNGILS